MFDDEWRLVYAGADYTFGTGACEVFNLTAPDLGDVALRVADADNPRTDGVSFGTDFRGGRTITFDLGVRGATEVEVRRSVEALAEVWRADVVRSTPGAMAEMRMRYRGEERVAFGRPRRFAPILKEAKAGFSSVTADFAAADDVFYSATEHDVEVALVPAPGGGLEAPLASPLTTTSSSDRSVGLTVSGALPTWPVITVEGPITNPEVEVVGLWRMAFNLSLAYDEVLTVDTRPWARTITRNGASVAGAITPRSARLSTASLPPGSYELALRGSSPSGTPVAHFRWRDAYSTP